MYQPFGAHRGDLICPVFTRAHITRRKDTKKISILQEKRDENLKIVSEYAFFYSKGKKTGDMPC
jgi:hypothetical protein